MDPVLGTSRKVPIDMDIFRNSLPLGGNRGCLSVPKQTEVLQTRLEYFFLTDIISNSTSGTARDFEEPHFSLTESLKVRELLKEGTVVMLSGCRVSLGK